MKSSVMRIARKMQQESHVILTLNLHQKMFVTWLTVQRVGLACELLSKIEDMKWNDHVDTIVRKAVKRWGMLGRLK